MICPHCGAETVREEEKGIGSHCGAENRVSMVLSLCPQCGQPLESAPSAEPERDWASPSEDEAPAEAWPTVGCPKCHRTCWAASENCPLCGADLRRRWIMRVGRLTIALGAFRFGLAVIAGVYRDVLPRDLGSGPRWVAEPRGMQLPRSRDL